HADAAARLLRRVNTVAHDVDQQLLELIGIGADRERVALDVDGETRLDAAHTPDESGYLERLLARCWQLRESRVRRREAAQRIGPRRDNREAALHVVLPVRRHLVACDKGFKTAGD